MKWWIMRDFAHDVFSFLAWVWGPLLVYSLASPEWSTGEWILFAFVFQINIWFWECIVFTVIKVERP